MPPEGTRPALPRRMPMLIDGEWAGGRDDRWLAVENPATKTDIAEVPRAAAADVDRAVRAAARAFDGWRALRPSERGAAVFRVADALEERAEELAVVLTKETGNAIASSSRPEVRVTVEMLRYYAGLAGEVKGETVPVSEAALSYTRREPLGVVGAIIPWNSPLIIAAVKLGPALVTGNTVVLKAAEDSPLAVLELARLFHEHLPAGVVNVVTGEGSEAGVALTQHPLVAKLSFTGSTEVGKAVMREAAERIVPVSLELGGKNPVIVFPDVADDERVIDGIIDGLRLSRQGQSCVAGTRLFIHESVFESVVDRVAARVRSMRVGDPLDDATQIGALNNRQQFDRVCTYIDDAMKQDGIRTRTGGIPDQDGPLGVGYFVEPSVFTDVRDDAAIWREEVFGPVLVGVPWSDIDDVVRAANDTEYGLAAFVWTANASSALRVAHGLEAGFVQVNQAGGALPGQTYGGYKQSGFGREYSLDGMLDGFTQRKCITVNLAFSTAIPEADAPGVHQRSEGQSHHGKQ